MYIWIGINVDDQLAGIKTRVKKIENSIGFEHSVFTLPFHVSLKISFSVSDDIAENIISDIINIYKDTAPFSLSVRGIEYEGNICWIRMVENEEIMALSTKLNLFLKEKYGIPLHEYDLDFKFHTTLFMSDDGERVKKAYLSVKDAPLPHVLSVNRFLIGVSESGALGTYKVAHEIAL
ncbi:MAG: 2'-5' RNA ligase family protein [Clostridia bacterium]|nr:2'-5' RNA ligase family protein [Clostridia bacterium]